MISTIHLDHPMCVGIDGVDASGKTMLAEELVEPLRLRDRTVIRASVDGFHNPRSIRHRQGRESAKGYYEDSFNHSAIISCVLQPLGPDGDLRYRASYFDFKTDTELNIPWQDADVDAILLFEGVFLHRPELRDNWDFSIFVHADFDVTINRAQERDLYLFETAKKIREIYKQRYIPGQKIYLETGRPFEKATVVLENNDLNNPTLKINRLNNQDVDYC